MKTHVHVVPIFDDNFNATEFAVMIYVKYLNRNFHIKTYESKQDARNAAYGFMCILENEGLAYFSLIISRQEGYPVFESTPAHYTNASEFPF